MARPVDARGRAMFDGGSNHGNMLRAKAQQIYSASSGGKYTGPTREGRPIGPTQGHSGLQQGAKGSEHKMDFRDAMNSRGELRESAVFRKRTDNMKNVDLSVNNVMRGDRQRLRLDRGYGMSIEDKANARDSGVFEGRAVSSAKIGSEVFNQIKKNFNEERSEIKENVGLKKGENIYGEEAARSSAFHDTSDDRRGASHLGIGNRNAISGHTDLKNDSKFSEETANSRRNFQIGNSIKHVDPKDPGIGNRNNISSEETANSRRTFMIGNNTKEAGSRNSSFDSSNTDRVRVQVRQADIAHSRNNSKSSIEDFDHRNKNSDISPRSSSVVVDVKRTHISPRSSFIDVNRPQNSSRIGSVDIQRAQIRETSNPINNGGDSLKKDFEQSKYVNRDSRNTSEGQDFEQSKIVHRDKDFRNSPAAQTSPRKIVISTIKKGSENTVSSESGVARFVRDNIKNLSQEVSSGKINVSSDRNDRYGTVNQVGASGFAENTPTSPPATQSHSGGSTPISPPSTDYKGASTTGSPTPTSPPITHNKGASGHPNSVSLPIQDNKHIGIVRSKSDEPLPNPPATASRDIKITVTSEPSQGGQYSFKQPGKPVSSMDKPDRKYQVQEKIVKIRKQSIDLLHTRQSSDPTQLMTRKLSNVSQDLMRSKEELISRSQECGRMLEKYKQKSEERKELSLQGEKQPPKPMERRSLTRDSSNDSASVRSSIDDTAEIHLANQARSLAEKASEENIEASSQSPRFVGKRKSSYIDSWLQSQQSRISTLVSAIKEEDSDDNDEVLRRNDEVLRRNDGLTRSRTKSVPPDSSLFLSWGRSDESSYDEDNSANRIEHTRSHSGEEVMGIARPRDPLRLIDRYNSPNDSPRTQRGYEQARVRAPRVTSYQDSRENYRYGRSIASDRQMNVRSPVEAHREGDRRVRPTDVAGPRSQSERTSPLLSHAFGNKKSVSVGGSPKLRKETTFEADVVTNLVPAADRPVASPGTTVSPRNSLHRRSSSSSDCVTRQQQEKISSKNSLTRRTSSSSDYVFSQQQQQQPLSRRTSSSSDYVISQPQQQQQQLTSSRQSTPTTSPSPTVTKQQEKIRSSPQPSQSPSIDMSPPNRSGNEDFDWPAPPDLDTLSVDDDPRNSWPSANGSSPPFSNGRSHHDSSRHYPVAVVKPLQHIRAQSLDHTASYPFSDVSKGELGRGSGLEQSGRNSELNSRNFSDSKSSVSTEFSEILNTDLKSQDFSPNEQTVSCYNVKIDTDQTNRRSALSRDSSSTNSQEFHEKAVDVEFGETRSSNSSFNEPPGVSSLITQDFEWYRPRTNTMETTESFERGDTRDSTRDKLERFGRFKRGSKLLSSKYMSFSKSLENLSKVGKDFIKGKRKSLDTDEKKDGKNADKHAKSAKDKPERRSMVVGDLELNDEFAMKMERRSMLSLDKIGRTEDYGLDFERRSFGAGTRQGKAEKRPASVEKRPGNIGKRSEAERLAEQKEKKAERKLAMSNTKVKVTTFDASPTPNTEIVSRSYDASQSTKPKHDERKRIPEGGRNFNDNDTISLSSQVPRRRGDNVIRRREVQSEYFESVDVMGARTRPKSEYYNNDSNSSLDNSGFMDNSSPANSGFVDYDDNDDDEDHKEMVKIVRKISGLRSSQFKKKNSVAAPPATKAKDPVQAKDSTKEQFEVKDSVEECNHRDDSLGSETNDIEGSRKTGVEENMEAPKILDEEETVKETVTDEQLAEPEWPEPPPGESTAESAGKSSDPDPMKRISTSLSRVMTDLRELREQDLTLATQLITLGKSIKHFKKQKKEMEDFYAILDEGESTEESDTSDDEEEYDHSYTGSRVTTDF